MLSCKNPNYPRVAAVHRGMFSPQAIVIMCSIMFSMFNQNFTSAIYFLKKGITY
jgi:hypothetical protein